MKKKSKEAKAREVMRAALTNPKRADEIVDAIIELQKKHDALLAKLDADTGTAQIDYEATLKTKRVED
jgi:plasmid stability protein